MSTTVEALNLSLEWMDGTNNILSKHMGVAGQIRLIKDIRKISDAIPRAELEGRLAGLMLDPHKGYDENGRISEEVDDLLLQLEALKAKDGTTRAA